MSERGKHLFKFEARQIAAAALRLAEYHEARAEFWKAEYEKSLEIVKKTASLEVREMAITGGTRAQMVVCYGDPGAHDRLVEASSKIISHRSSAANFRSDYRVYSTQGIRPYEMAPDDVQYYQLDGRPLQED